MLKVVKFEAKFEADAPQTSYLTATGDTSREFGVHFSAGINLILLAFTLLTVSPAVWEVDESKWTVTSRHFKNSTSDFGIT